jgi:hypothetical protein
MQAEAKHEHVAGGSMARFTADRDGCYFSRDDVMA